MGNIGNLTLRFWQQLFAPCAEGSRHIVRQGVEVGGDPDFPGHRAGGAGTGGTAESHQPGNRLAFHLAEAGRGEGGV